MGILRGTERALTASALLLLAVLPVLEIALRSLLRTGIPGTSGYVQALTLWAGFLGSMVASRDGRHLTLGRLAPTGPGCPRG